MNIKKINNLASLYENLVSFAALEDELMKLDTSEENKDFIKSIEDMKYKGKIFSFLRKNPNISLQELKSQLEKEKGEDARKEQLRESAVPTEWLAFINHLAVPRLSVYLRGLARAKKLPVLDEKVKEQLETIKNWLQEHPDEAIDNLQVLCCSCHKIKTQNEKEHGCYVKMNHHLIIKFKQSWIVNYV